MSKRRAVSICSSRSSAWLRDMPRSPASCFRSDGCTTVTPGSRRSGPVSRSRFSFCLQTTVTEFRPCRDSAVATDWSQIDEPSIRLKSMSPYRAILMSRLMRRSAASPTRCPSGGTG